MELLLTVVSRTKCIKSISNALYCILLYITYKERKPKVMLSVVKTLTRCNSEENVKRLGARILVEFLAHENFMEITDAAARIIIALIVHSGTQDEKTAEYEFFGLTPLNEAQMEQTIRKRRTTMNFSSEKAMPTPNMLASQNTLSRPLINDASAVMSTTSLGSGKPQSLKSSKTISARKLHRVL